MSWPPSIVVLSDYISYMSLRQYAFSTVSCHISAISYVNKVNHLIDNTKHFAIRSMLEGFRRMHKKQDSRLPITKDVLKILLGSLKLVCCTQYECMMFSAAFCLAYICLLRVSEFALPHRNSKKSILNIENVLLNQNTIRLHLQNSKTDQRHIGSFVDVKINSENKFCFEHLDMYFKVRAKIHGPFFCHHDGSPLTTFQFNAVFKKALANSGLESSHYKSHSFRIGGATNMFREGHSIDDIKHRGRWQSNAYKSYIR